MGEPLPGHDPSETERKERGNEITPFYIGR